MTGLVVDRPEGPRDLADWLLARGRHWVTAPEVAVLLEVPLAHVAPTLARWVSKGLLFSPTKGAYVPIPPHYRDWGAVPGSEFIDAMMRHLGHEYYVCLLSAAEVHGFAHQRPQVFQVMTAARLRDRSFGRVQLSFVYSAAVALRPTVTRNTPTGVLRVSSLECTILDLVSVPLRSGGLSNIGTILCEVLGEERLDPKLLCDAATGYPASVVARTGWMIEFAAGEVGEMIDVESLRSQASARVKPTLLDSQGLRTGELDNRWNLIVNSHIEVDS
jgi:predicted transcriptional regulator of viral defense system